MLSTVGKVLDEEARGVIPTLGFAVAWMDLTAELVFGGADAGVGEVTMTGPPREAWT